MIALLVIHAVVGLAVFAGGRRLGRRALVIGALAPLSATVWLISQWDRVIDGGVVRETVAWVPALGVHGALRLDGFALLMALAVALVGVGVLIYSYFYFGPDDDTVSRFAGLLVLFAGAMLGVVLADDLITLFTAWELTSITSYLLIGNKYTERKARAAALHALLVTSLGGLVLLAGIVLVGEAAGTYRLSEILADPPAGTSVTVGLMCMLVGAFTKSAQYPFHAWLPGAMAAPTPASAYLHSATMVKAGVYLVGRLAPVFAATPGWRPVVLVTGGVTMIVGALRALRQYDLKLLLAYGTVSQLGFLMILFGSGTPASVHAGVVMLAAHILFKAALFMVVGIVDHQTGTRDIRLLPVLRSGWMRTAVVALVSAASMAGIPLLAGFIGKEAGFTALYDGGFGGSVTVLAIVVIGSAFTAAYSARFVWGLLALPRRMQRGDEQVATPVEDDANVVHDPASPRLGFLVPAVLLALGSVVIGVVPGVLDRLAAVATVSLSPGAQPVHLSIWHGLNAPLGLSAVALVVGALLFRARGLLAPILRLGSRIPSGLDVYQRTLSVLNTVATRTIGVVQNGSLPIYLGVILVTATVLPVSVLLYHGSITAVPEIVGQWAAVPIVALLVSAASAAAVIRRRFTAVLFLSVVGYSMAGLFVVWGAPDLALTQAAVETVSTVLFVLVLRRLPDRFERRSTKMTMTLRVAVSATVATGIFLFALAVSTARRVEPVSTAMLDRALPDGKGRNVVNVILVDFRGFDTMGEIAVLTVAAIGTVAIAHAGRKRRASRGGEQ